jgi:THUMP domain-like/RNA cap guanine-N2 methyltransferase
MRRAGDADAESWVLTTDEGRELLAEVCGITAPRPADLTRWRRTASPDHVAAALRLAEGRRRGAAKFTRADQMWFDPTGLEQATAEPVARHKARRFATGSEVVVDLCCGVGGDALALAAEAGRRVVAVDRDAGMCRRTLWNARVYDVAERVLAVRGEAGCFPVPAGAWVHIDPDRRARRPEGARAKRLEGYEPGLDVLRSIVRRGPAGAIKLGPASDFAEHFGGAGFEVEVVSLGGECKEATVWFGEAAGCHRRATRLPQGATWTDRDGGDGAAPTGPIHAWVFDPDPSLARAGLLDGFAVAHGLGRFADGVDFLSGPALVASAFLAAFEVLDVFPLDLKRLKHEVAARGLGPLEIKTKGLDLTPEQVRARLKPSGDSPATLLLSGGRGPARAVLARRVVG